MFHFCPQNTPDKVIMHDIHIIYSSGISAVFSKSSLYFQLRLNVTRLKQLALIGINNV